jgi:NADH-quinone oxidoreductase subunit N
VERESGDDRAESFAGLVHRSPFQAVCLLVFLASLAGIPPLAGFFGKFALFSNAVAESAAAGKPGLVWLVGLAAILSAVSLYYYLTILKQAFVKTAPEDAVAGSGVLPATHTLCVALPAVMLVVLGLYPTLLLAPLAKAVAEMLH